MRTIYRKENVQLTYDHEQFLTSWPKNSTKVVSTIYKESFQSIYRYIYFRVYNEEDAQDITEEVYMKLLKQLNHYDGKESISSWLYQIARTEIANFWRKNYQFDEKLVDDLAALEDEMDDDHRKADQIIDKILKDLPENYAQVLELRFLKGYTLEESARELHTTVSNIKVLQHRALKKAGEITI
jgi:RNA polymerase sigma factor (sigma-70 family)